MYIAKFYIMLKKGGNMKEIIKYTLSNKNHPFASVQNEKEFLIPEVVFDLENGEDNNTLEESAKVKQEAELFLCNLLKTILFDQTSEDGEGYGKWEYDMIDQDHSHITLETKYKELDISISCKYD